MKSVLLFQPKLGFYDLFTQDMPVGILTIAASLPAEYDVTIIDQRLAGWEKKLDSALKTVPLCIGFSVTTGEQISHALQVTQRVKSIANITTVWGGVHPTLLPRQTLENESIDIVVQGEGEIAFPLLLQHLSEGKEPRAIGGVWYKKGGTLVPGTVNTPIDVNSLPPLPYSLIDFNEYPLYAQGKAGRIFPIEAGRGCVHHCAYCYHAGAAHTPRRAVSAPNILQRIHHLRKYAAIEGISLIDDSFLTEKKRALEFAGLVKEHHLSFRWGCEANASDISRFTDDELRLLKTAGLTWLAIGVESGSDKILKEIHKDLTVGQLRETSRRLCDHQFLVRYNFMSGYITETTDDLRQTTRLMFELLHDGGSKASVQSLRPVTPYPGTPYHDTALKAGMSAPARLEDWADFAADRCDKPLPWIGTKKRRLLTVLYLASFFIDHKSDASKDVFGRIMERMISLYRHIALWRFKRNSAFFPLELVLYDIFKKWQKQRYC